MMFAVEHTDYKKAKLSCYHILYSVVAWLFAI